MMLDWFLCQAVMAVTILVGSNKDAYFLRDKFQTLMIFSFHWDKLSPGQTAGNEAILEILHPKLLKFVGEK